MPPATHGDRNDSSTGKKISTDSRTDKKEQYSAGTTDSNSNSSNIRTSKATRSKSKNPEGKTTNSSGETMEYRAQSTEYQYSEKRVFVAIYFLVSCPKESNGYGVRSVRV